jgi:short-subunit dehydrogenase
MLKSLSQDKLQLNKMIYSINLKDLESLSITLQSFPITGVIYAAGINRDSLLYQGGALASLEQVWNAKAQAVHFLDEEFQLSSQYPYLKYFIVLSSIVAKIGRQGQSVYAATNAFVDEVMQKQSSDGISYLSTW